MKIAQSCLTLCDPHGLYSPWHSIGQNTGEVSLLQGIFPTQESNQGLLHCRWILYQLSYEGSPSGRKAETPQSPQLTWSGALGLHLQALSRETPHLHHRGEVRKESKAALLTAPTPPNPASSFLSCIVFILHLLRRVQRTQPVSAGVEGGGDSLVIAMLQSASQRRPLLPPALY